MKVYVVLVGNEFESVADGGVMAEVFTSKEAAELCCPYAEWIQECEVDKEVQYLDPSDAAKLQNNS